LPVLALLTPIIRSSALTWYNCTSVAFTRDRAHPSHHIARHMGSLRISQRSKAPAWVDLTTSSPGIRRVSKSQQLAHTRASMTWVRRCPAIQTAEFFEMHQTRSVIAVSDLNEFELVESIRGRQTASLIRGMAQISSRRSLASDSARQPVSPTWRIEVEFLETRDRPPDAPRPSRRPVKLRFNSSSRLRHHVGPNRVAELYPLRFSIRATQASQWQTRIAGQQVVENAKSELP